MMGSWMARVLTGLLMNDFAPDMELMPYRRV